MAKKKPKPKFVDDGRTIANMNVEGMRWYNPGLPSGRGAQGSSNASGQGAEQPEPLQLTKKERRAIMRAAVWTALKLALIPVCGFAIAMLLLSLWLH